MTNCPSCSRDVHIHCDGTAWNGNHPTFCECWANGHPWTGTDPGRWVGGEGAPQEDAAMDAYERGRGD